MRPVVNMRTLSRRAVLTTDVATFLVGFLRELVPPPVPEPGAAGAHAIQAKRSVAVGSAT